MTARRNRSGTFALICALALSPFACKPPEKEQDLGDKLEAAAEKVGEALNKAVDEMEEGADSAKESLQKAGDDMERAAEKLEKKLDDEH
ncbi:MAG: YtxH domain-containing protein [Acidobacteriota bacterium]|nr:YtxH domain-containing protein [Acidobacteriota bacterium]